MSNFLSILFLPPVIRGFIGMMISGACFPLWGVMVLKLKLIPLRYMLMHGVILGGAIALAMMLPPIPVIIFTNIILVLIMIMISKDQSFGFSGGSAAIMVISMALASVITHVKSVPAKDSLDLLWGSPFALSNVDIIVLAVVFILSLIYLIFNFKNILALFYNDEIAKAMGIKTSLNYTVIVMLIGVIIAVGMKLLGAFLIDSLLLLPVLCCSSLLKNFSKKSGVKRLFISSGITGFVFSVVGYLIAVGVDCPPSGIIALFAGVSFMITGLASFLRNHFSGGLPGGGAFRSVVVLVVVIGLSGFCFVGCNKTTTPEHSAGTPAVATPATPERDAGTPVDAGEQAGTPMVADTPSGVAESPETSPVIVASTSWTAAFAYLGGADNISIVAPANLRHPPEYELTAGDVVRIRNCDYFIYAGFERMMKTLGEKVAESEGPVMVKIRCDNSIATVTESAGKIAEALGTVEESKKRVARYVAAVEGGRKAVEEAGLKGAKVLCNKNQIYLAAELGFDVAGIFGPGPVSPTQIADAKNGNYLFIIDNIHNPVGKPLAEVAPESEYIIWRNFPENIENESLTKLIIENLQKIL